MASFFWQRQQVVGSSAVRHSLHILNAPVVVDVHPSARKLRIAIRAPHRVVAILFNEGNHFFPCVNPTLDDPFRIIDLIPPEVADVFMPRAASHPASRTFYCCCHGEALSESAKKWKVRCRRTCSIATKNPLVKQKKYVYSEHCEWRTNSGNESSNRTWGKDTSTA